VYSSQEHYSVVVGVPANDDMTLSKALQTLRKHRMAEATSPKKSFSPQFRQSGKDWIRRRQPAPKRVLVPD